MERIREDRPITIKDDKGNLNRCIADVVSVRPRRLRGLGWSGGPLLPTAATRGHGSPGLLELHSAHTHRAGLSTAQNKRGGEVFLPGRTRGQPSRGSHAPTALGGHTAKAGPRTAAGGPGGTWRTSQAVGTGAAGTQVTRVLRREPGSSRGPRGAGWGLAWACRWPPPSAPGSPPHSSPALHHGDGQAAPGDPCHGRGGAPGGGGSMAVGRGGLPVQEARHLIHRSSLTCGS